MTIILKLYLILKEYGFEIGKKVIFKDDEIVLLNEGINEEIVKVNFDRKKREGLLEKKYPDLWPKRQVFPSTDTIIEDYLKQRKEEGKNIDLYVVGIISQLASAMGIKVCLRHNGSYYDQSGFDYPEQIQDIVEAMYEIISEYLAEIKDNENIEFKLCEYGRKGKEYFNFTKEIEKRTGYNHERITSDLKMKLDSADFHGESLNIEGKSFEQLRAMKPTIYISKKQTVYIPDRSNENEGRIIITPELCEKNYHIYSKTDSRSKIDEERE